MKTRFVSLMGFLLAVLIVNMTSCKSDETEQIVSPKVEKLDKQEDLTEEIEESPEIPEENRAFAFEGTIKNSIPIFMHFTVVDSVLSGEITYMNTKAKQPIRIIGEVETSHYRILEFAKDGFISGIINLDRSEEAMSGTWYASGNENSFEMKVEPSDSIVEKCEITAVPHEVFGTYSYSYTKDAGNTGDFTIKKESAHEALFEIIGVHSAPGYNIASIEETKVPFPAGSKTLFFNIPEEESCDFEVQFYKDFAIVKYVNGYCQMGYFGHNATVEGIFLKVK